MAGRQIDVGLFAESLIYYDKVIICPGNQEQFACFVGWFVRQGKFLDLLALIRDGVIGISEYSFLTAPIKKDDVYILMNVQDEVQAQKNSFERRFLYHESLEKVVKEQADRRKLYAALRDKVIENKADDYSVTVEESRADFGISWRQALVVQAFVDELYELKRVRPVPKIEAKVENVPEGTRTTINISTLELWNLAGPQLQWHAATPLSGAALCNNLIYTSSRHGWDLYLPRPMSILVGDKLYESASTIGNSKETVQTLKKDVEFPDIRRLVNDGRLDLPAILEIRHKARRFRSWLQDESNRDRDAIVAYHNEVAKESGFRGAGRHILSMFGFIGGGAIGGGLGAVMAGPVGGVIGGAIGGAASYAADVGSKIGAGWRPVVFGNWLIDRIAQLDQGRPKRR
jgi:hypothetical protein